ncbi:MULTISPECIES: NAD(+)/NADH kinase [Methanoculleus]|jgi:NAD+ kinase|uniref:NAD kinase n=1 Tax=Methanoculleus thermophilus TaxID=2200 RepID=A0A1G8YND5_9EURY|nr:MULTISPECIES: NAD(+)/NADH kinase [Methanoculleus]NLN08036.1 NAD(+)/NADH kinase [Methanoculleus thermophilus]SDK03560.1 NAD+ kinase [Methanoculleus thermophilus]HQD26331.1 NAD(+)/NADH kinase [Methanoculleus thermophilus]
MKAVLVSRIDDTDALRYTAELARDLEALGHEVALEEGTAREIGEKGIPFEDFSGDLVVVVGGDGSVLLTVHQMKTQLPVIGVNWGEVGFLADLEPDEARAFFAAHKTGFQVERRMRISLSVDGRYFGDALNEAVIVTDRPAKMLRFTVYVDGTPAERVRADGLLVSTPTGSTAYAMSAGGPIIDPQIEGILIIPLAPYMLSSRPHLISTRRDLEIRLETEKPAHLVIDGQSTFELERNATVTVRKSDQPALFVHTDKPFFEKVNHKLRNL